MHANYYFHHFRMDSSLPLVIQFTYFIFIPSDVNLHRISSYCMLCCNGFCGSWNMFISGIVFFTIRWWDPETFAAMHPVGKAARTSWPYIEDKSYLWTWLFLVPLVVYTLWQLLYFLIVNVLRRQRLLRDPEVMTSYRSYFTLFPTCFCIICEHAWPLIIG